jgi:hypothetical protein
MLSMHIGIVAIERKRRLQLVWKALTGDPRGKGSEAHF